MKNLLKRVMLMSNKPSKPKPHNKYIQDIKVDDIIAFKLNKKSNKIYSGKVVDINGKRITCESKLGSIFYITSDYVEWVKKNRWPTFIMEGFKYKEETNGYNRVNL